MIISFCCFCCIICAWPINLCGAYTEYPSIQLEGVIGDSVVLPCASSKNEHNLRDINVSWRHNDSLNVYDIKDGHWSTEHQDPVLKNRIQAIFEENRKGNFSIRLHKLTHSDAGKYQCFISHSSELVTIQLLINERTEAKEKPQAPDVGNHAGETTGMRISVPALCFSAVIYLCMALIL